MSQVDVIKYYSVYTSHSLSAVEASIREKRARYPNREYAILTNMRGGAKKFVGAQVEHLTVDVPVTEEELNLPPMPERPRHVSMASQAYKDYQHEIRKREEAIRQAILPALKLIRRKLNTP